MPQYKATPGRESQIYVGINPVTKQGLMKKKIGDFSQEEFAAWLELNPASAKDFVVVTGGGQPKAATKKPLPKPDKDDK